MFVNAGVGAQKKQLVADITHNPITIAIKVPKVGRGCAQTTSGRFLQQFQRNSVTAEAVHELHAYQNVGSVACTVPRNSRYVHSRTIQFIY